MSTDAFQELEERIGQAVTRIRTLTEERTRLTSRQEELEEKLAELSGRNRRLESELAELRENEGARGDFETARREIERRVEGLLERFTELDELTGE
jgi:predicted  nucleic acid-binding Zn-ribbon protein